MRLHDPQAWFPAVAAALALVISATSTAFADAIRITVTNSQPAGGFGISPVWFGLHDGTYQTFAPGASASAGVQAIAELGDSSGLVSAFNGHGDQVVVGSAPMGPGGTASGMLNAADPSMNRFLSFGAMVVPSNDFFMANNDPQAFEIFDAAGAFLGPKTIMVFGRDVWDAGTEVNDVAFGAAFIVGDDATDHVAENGVVALVFGGPDQSAYLDSILGQPTPYGYDVSHLISSDDLIATFQIEAVPEPSGLLLVGTGVVGVLISVSRRGTRRGERTRGTPATNSLM